MEEHLTYGEEKWKAWVKDSRPGLRIMCSFHMRINTYSFHDFIRRETIYG